MECPRCGKRLELAVIRQSIGSSAAEQPSAATSLAAQQKMDGMEAQVRQLTEKLAAAVDRAADLEDELQARPRLGSDDDCSSAKTATPTAPAGRLGALIAAHRSHGAMSASKPHKKLSLDTQLGPSTETAQTSQRPRPNEDLQQERTLRLEAEAKLDSLRREIEDLSQSLFEEANSMVAHEKAARVRLEKKLKSMEAREEERRRRLHELEDGVARILRVRRLLQDDTAA